MDIVMLALVLRHLFFNMKTYNLFAMERKMLIAVKVCLNVLWLLFLNLTMLSMLPCKYPTVKR